MEAVDDAKDASGLSKGIYSKLHTKPLHTISKGEKNDAGMSTLILSCNSILTTFSHFGS